MPYTISRKTKEERIINFDNRGQTNTFDIKDTLEERRKHISKDNLILFVLLCLSLFNLKHMKVI